MAEPVAAILALVYALSGAGGPELGSSLGPREAVRPAVRGL
jgi:hypothetical protein